MKNILESGKRHGTTEGDIYGALFFHAKEQFTLFAQRLEALNITVTVSCLDAIEIASILRDNPSAYGFSSLPRPVKFDRVDTSNIADWNYVGIEAVLTAWGPLLNRKNRHAVLLTHFMNWAAMQPGGSVAGASPSQPGRATGDEMKAMEAATKFFVSTFPLLGNPYSRQLPRQS